MMTEADAERPTHRVRELAKLTSSPAYSDSQSESDNVVPTSNVVPVVSRFHFISRR